MKNYWSASVPVLVPINAYLNKPIEEHDCHLIKDTVIINVETINMILI